MSRNIPVSRTLKSEISDPARIRIGAGCRLPQPAVESARIRLSEDDRLPR